MKYLVTGATGLLGNNVVRQLLERGHDVRVLVRPGSDHRPLDSLHLDIVLGDVCVPQSVHAAMQGQEFVIHAAGSVHIGWRQLEKHRRINVGGTRNVAQAARHVGARMVHVSSVDALPAGRPNQPADETTPDQPKVACTYVVTKREAEDEVRAELANGLDAVIVNPGYMLGPWDWKPSSGKMLIGVATNWTPLAPTGGFSGCDVRDVTDGILAAAEKGTSGERFILAGQNMTYLDGWRLFSQVTGTQPPWFRMGPLVRYGAGWIADCLAWATGREGDVNSATIQMSALFNYYDSGLAQRRLGYRQRPFRESVEAAWAWFQEYGYA